MAEVDAAHRGGGHHRERFGERDADRGRVEQREQRALLGVVGTRGIAERRTDATIGLVDELLWREVFGGRVAPVFAGLRVQRSEEHTSELQSPMYLVCR